MGRTPCYDKSSVKKGLWTPEEDNKLLAYVSIHGTKNWVQAPKKAGLNRCHESCRLRWTNYLRPGLKHGNFTPQEEELIISLHGAIGNRWSVIAKRLPGRTNNDIKNHWNTKLRKKLMKMGIDPVTHKPVSQVLSDLERISGIPSSGMNFINKDLMSNMVPNITESSDAKQKSIVEHTQEKQVQLCENHVQYHHVSEVASSSSLSSLPNLTRLSSFDWSEFQQPLVNKQCEGHSSSGNAFVDAILDKDSEIRAAFPESLDVSFDC